MSETTFTASNDIRIERDGRGRVKVFSEDIEAKNVLTDYDYLEEDEVDALSEFFQHERDEELGRWRWPEQPNLVVYRSAPPLRMVLVTDERTGVSAFIEEGSKGTGLKNEAANAYFAAHPEPKPWHDAKPGEVWRVEAGSVNSVDGAIMTVFRDESGPIATTHFGYWDGPDPESIDIESADIQSARRIWPEFSG